MTELPDNQEDWTEEHWFQWKRSLSPGERLALKMELAQIRKDGKKAVRKWRPKASQSAS